MLSLLVFIHEAGHFFVAKKSGMHVEEFGFGFPPRALGVKKGDTIYSINWLPFGGFVKLFGEDEAGAGRIGTGPKNIGITNARPFYAFPLKNRIAVVAAGIIMNLLLAIVMYYLLLASQGFKEILFIPGNFRFTGVDQKNYNVLVFGDPKPNSPAALSGLKSDDLLISYDGQTITSVDSFLAYLRQHQTQQVSFTVIENYDLKTIPVTLRSDPSGHEGVLGIAYEPRIQKIVYLNYSSPLHRLTAGAAHAYNVSVFSIAMFGKLIGTSFAKHDIQPVSQGVAGPVGIGKLVSEILGIGGKKAVIGIIDLMALLSLNLAIVNVLPFPALDGGRLFFLIIEGITRRRVHPQFEQFANTVGMAILLGLIVLITANDLLKFFH